MTSTTATLLFVEHVVWEPRDDWRDALEHVAGRFSRVAPLDVDAVLSQPGLVAQLEQLESWAGGAGADLDRELGRWFDEHLSMHLRPDPTVTRAVRALAADAPLHLASALPPRVAEAIARHAGCWRSAAALHAPLRDPDAVATTLGTVGEDVRVVAGPGTELPATVHGTSLAAARS